MAPPRPTAATNRSELTRMMGEVTTTSNAKEIRNEVHKLAAAHGVQLSQYLPTDRQLADLILEIRRGANLSPEAGETIDPESQIPPEFYPVETQPGNADLPHSSSPELRWVKIPQGENRGVLNSIAREVSPNGSTHQDGLNCFLKAASAPNLSEGNKLESGAALMFTKAELATILSALAQRLPSVELFQAAAFLQSVIPMLIVGKGSAGLEAALQKCLPNLSMKPGELQKFFAALLEICGQCGLSAALPGMQELMVQILDKAQAKGTSVDHPALGSLDGLQGVLQTAGYSGVPLLNGLQEFGGGGGLWQRLSQLLQPLMRALSGFFLTNPESQWPRTLPNEKFLSELGALFGSQLYRSNAGQTRRRKRRKAGSTMVFRHQHEESAEEEAAQNLRDLLTSDHHDAYSHFPA